MFRSNVITNPLYNTRLLFAHRPVPPSGMFDILIVIAYCSTAPTAIVNDLLTAGANSVDVFNAASSTPTLAQLQDYDIVITSSFCTYANKTTLGNNLADYVDGGGVVIQNVYDWYSGNYSP